MTLSPSKGMQREPTLEGQGGNGPLIPWSSQTPGEQGERDTVGHQACVAAVWARHNMPLVQLKDLTRF